MKRVLSSLICLAGLLSFSVDAKLLPWLLLDDQKAEKSSTETRKSPFLSDWREKGDLEYKKLWERKCIKKRLMKENYESEELSEQQSKQQSGPMFDIHGRRIEDSESESKQQSGPMFDIHGRPIEDSESESKKKDGPMFDIHGRPIE